MPATSLKIVTRRSPLAMWQAEHVAAKLRESHRDLRVEITGVTTEADRFLDASLSALGGKGAFVKELEQALLAGRADLAVHSMKDVPADLPAGLVVGAILAREDPRDVLVSLRHGTLAELPPGARVGTASLRRRCQLLHHYPGLDIRDIRGNVGTRIEKLDRDEFDALVLAAAGVRRLGFAGRVREYLPVETLLPAPGQGALGVECRADDERVLDAIRVLDDPDSRCCVSAERAVNRRLAGGCHVPLAAHAHCAGGRVELAALVGKLDGSEILRVQGSRASAEAEALGTALGEDLLGHGAAEILQEAKDGRGR